MRILAAIGLASALASACNNAPAPAAHDAPDTPSHAAAQAVVYDERVAIFLLADSATLARIRAETGADYETIGDDMMWYRAEAWTWLEERAVPVVAIEGRDSLRFRVDGAVRAFGFDDVTTADAVVLYEPGRVPHAVAPIDVPGEAALYFNGLPDPSQ